MILKLAVKANTMIITYNPKDFLAAKKFNVSVLSAKELLRLLGEIY